MSVTNKPFSHNLAFVIGVSHYNDTQIATLKNPLNDVRLLSEKLAEQDFDVISLLDPTANEMRTFLEKMKAQCQSPDMRVLVYYAGHGLQEDGAMGLKGYLVPSDAQLGNTDTYIAMQSFSETLNELKARHVLLVLDCCFAGTFRFSTKRDIMRLGAKKQKLTRQYYDMFTQEPSRKVLTSTSSRQKAFDHIELGDENSPFAKIFVEALQGASDQGNNDKLITAVEVQSYLKNQLTQISKTAGNQQSVELGSLEGDGDGEFVFFLDGFDDKKLTEGHYQNPYKGLKSYDYSDSGVYFGRQQAVEDLFERARNSHFVVLTGASGTGKSSLVKAGLLPKMYKAGMIQQPSELKMPIIRPGKAPSVSLPQNDDWDILIIDQWEEVVTQAQDAEDVVLFNQKLKDWLDKGKRIIGTVRADFEAQVRNNLLEDYWVKGRFLVPAFSPNDYHDIIVQPARRVGCTFESETLVEDIKKEVNGELGPLPLLSFLLQELFEKAKQTSASRWQIKRQYYTDLGGLSGALQGRAEQVYADLHNTEGAQDVMRRLMLRMVSLSAGELASKRVFMEDLNFGQDELVKQVIKALDEARLIRLSTPEVEKKTQNTVQGEADKKAEQTTKNDKKAYLEPAHDALVRSWKRLWDWVKEMKEENVLLFDKVMIATLDYKNNDSSKKFLWQSDARLDLALALLKSDSPMNQSERHFIGLSQKVRRQNKWILRGSVIGAFLILGILALWANNQRLIAQKQARTAENLATAITYSETNPTLAVRMLEYIYNKHPDNSAAKVNYYKILNDTIHAFYQMNYAGHQSEIQSIAISKNNKIALTTGTVDTLAMVWDFETGKILHKLRGHSDLIVTSALSANGKIALTGSLDSTVKVWNTETGVLLHTFSGHRNTINKVAINADATQAISASSDSTIILWNVQTGGIIKQLPKNHAYITGLDWNADVQKLLIGTDSVAYLWDTRKGKLLKTFKYTVQSEGAGILAVAISADGKRIATGGGDSKAVIWDAQTGRFLQECEGHGSSISSLAFNADGSKILTGSYDNTAKLWDTRSGKILREFNGHTGFVNSVALSADGTKAFTASSDSTVKVWDIDTDRKLADIQQDSLINSLALNANGTLALTSGFNNSACLWDVLTGKKLQTFSGHTNEITVLALSADGKRALTGSRDNTAKLWDTETGKLLYNFVEGTDDADDVLSVALNATGTKVLIATSKPTVKLRDATTGQVLREFVGHQAEISFIALSNDEKILLTNSNDATGKIWDAQTGKLLHTVNPNELSENSINDVALSSDGKRFAIAQMDRVIRLYDTQTGKLLHKYMLKENIRDIALSDNGSRLLVCMGGDYDISKNSEVVQLLDGETGKLLREFSANRSSMWGATISADGKRLIANVENKFARLWGSELNCGEMTPFAFPFSIKELMQNGLKVEPSDEK
ncbi:MAG: caspase family protein [Saprospiraceae bacterium]|nr:caspase family protein [Saprospiraceae bacterium]